MSLEDRLWAQRDKERKTIIAKLIADEADDLSDETIYRSFYATCTPDALIRVATRLRDEGEITVADLHPFDPPAPPLHVRGEDAREYGAQRGQTTLGVWG